MNDEQGITVPFWSVAVPPPSDALVETMQKYGLSGLVMACSLVAYDFSDSALVPPHQRQRYDKLAGRLLECAHCLEALRRDIDPAQADWQIFHEPRTGEGYD